MMRFLKGSLILLFVAAAVVAPGASVSAATVTKSGIINVKSEVLPNHAIVVDAEGVILQIISNTSDDITKPRVYEYKVIAGSEKPLSDNIYTEYRRLVPTGSSHAGILYEQKLSAKQTSTPLTLLLQKAQLLSLLSFR